VCIGNIGVLIVKVKKNVRNIRCLVSMFMLRLVSLFSRKLLVLFGLVK